MKQNAKDIIHYSTALFMVATGVLLCFLSFFLNCYHIEDSVLWYMAQALTFCGGVFGVTIWVRQKYGEIQSYVDRKMKSFKNEP